MNVLPDVIETQVISALSEIPALAQEQGWDDTAWTRGVKLALTRIGNRMGYSVYASSTAEAKGGEWLFDVTWIEESDGYLLSIPLVVESEWHPDGASDDFQKLLVARADHRLMILSARRSASPEDAVNILIRAVRQCKLPAHGERYLFACWNAATKGFVFKSYVVGSGLTTDRI